MRFSTIKSRLAAGAAGLFAGASLTAMAIAAPVHADSPVSDKPSPALVTGTTPPSLPDIVERVSPSVVQIIVRQSADVQRLAGPGEFDGIPQEFRRFFGPEFGFDFGDGFNGRQLPDRVGAGSGFFIDGGYIVTNNHVVDHAKKLRVRLDDGSEVDAKLVGTDDKTDLAVIKVDSKYARQPLQWGDSNRSRVGDNVFTIGAPFSLGNTVTAGIISARGRDISSGPYDDYFQIDAPINPGNSGGPMFNSAGQVIGVNTAIYSPSGGNVGIGFSIPADQARQVVQQIIEHGRVERGWLGVSIQKVTPDIAEGVGLPRAEGALVADVTAGSPAEKAGLKVRDVILAYAGRPVKTMHDLTRAVADTRPGAKEELKVFRDGRELKLRVTIAQPQGEGGEKASATSPFSASDTSFGDIGLELRKDGKGVVISDITSNSPAADAGLREGDQIVSIDEREIAEIKDARQAVADARAKNKSAVLVGLRRGTAKLFVGLPLSR